MENIKTGDLLLFSRKSAPGLFVRTFMNSTWNHVGIALRFKDLGRGKSCDDGLYVLDVRAVRRYDAWSNQVKSGAGCSPIEYSLKNSCSIAWRKMDDQYRTSDYFRRLKNFIDQSIGTKNGTTSQMLSVWSGFNLYQGDDDQCSCSEFIARCLDHLQVPREKLGKNYPDVNWLASPGSFSARKSGRSDYYETETYIYHHPRPTITYIVVVISFILLVLIVLWLWSKIKPFLTTI